MKKQELSNRDKLREKKPHVLEKILKHEKEAIPRIQLQYRYNCNFKCEHCSIDNVKDKSRKSLTLDDIRDIYGQADDMGISRTTITGGEPLIFPDLDELVEAINPNKFWIQVDTNGFYASKEKIFHLKDIGIDCVAPSLDSLDKKAHDDFRNAKGSADKVLKAFDYIQEAELNTFVQTVVTKSRLHSDEFIKFIEYFNNRDVGVFVSFAKPVGAYSGCFDELINRNDLRMMEELEKQYKVFTHLTPAYGINEERNCVASRNIFAITEYGDVLPCIYFYCSMGNVLEEPLKEIHEICLKLKPFQKNTCVLADKDDDFIDKYLVNKIYDKKLPVNYLEVFTGEDFEE